MVVRRARGAKPRDVLPESSPASSGEEGKSVASWKYNSHSLPTISKATRNGHRWQPDSPRRRAQRNTYNRTHTTPEVPAQQGESTKQITLTARLSNLSVFFSNNAVAIKQATNTKEWQIMTAAQFDLLVRFVIHTIAVIIWAVIILIAETVLHMLHIQGIGRLIITTLEYTITAYITVYNVIRFFCEIAIVIKKAWNDFKKE